MALHRQPPRRNDAPRPRPAPAPRVGSPAWANAQQARGDKEARDAKVWARNAAAAERRLARQKGGSGTRALAPGEVAPVVTGPGAPPPVFQPSNFDFAVNADPTAQSDMADLTSGFNEETGGSLDAAGNFIGGATQGTIGAKFGELKRSLESRRPIIEQKRFLDRQNMLSGMAGRGLVRSGLKEAGDLGIEGEAMAGRDEVERLIQGGIADEATARSQAAGRYIGGKNRITTGAAGKFAQDNIDNFEDIYGPGSGSLPAPAAAPGAPGAPAAPAAPDTRDPTTAIPVGGPPKKPPSLAQFIASHPGGNKAKLTAAFKKRFG